MTPWPIPPGAAPELVGLADLGPAVTLALVLVAAMVAPLLVELGLRSALLAVMVSCAILLSPSWTRALPCASSAAWDAFGSCR